MKLGTSVIPHFHVILTAQSISKIILFIQGHLQGQKVNFKGGVKRQNGEALKGGDRLLKCYQKGLKGNDEALKGNDEALMGE